MSSFMWYSLLRRYTCNCLFSPQMGSGKKFPPVLAHNLPSVSPQGKLLPGVPQSTLKCRCAQIQIYISLCVFWLLFLTFFQTSIKRRSKDFASHFTHFTLFTFHIATGTVWHLGWHPFLHQFLALFNKRGSCQLFPSFLPPQPLSIERDRKAPPLDLLAHASKYIAMLMFFSQVLYNDVLPNTLNCYVMSQFAGMIMFFFQEHCRDANVPNAI